MTDEDLALIRRTISDGLGLTHGRAARLLAALDEARDVAAELWKWCPADQQWEAEIYGRHPWMEQESSQGVNDG